MKKHMAGVQERVIAGEAMTVKVSRFDGGESDVNVLFAGVNCKPPRLVVEKPVVLLSDVQDYIDEILRDLEGRDDVAGDIEVMREYADKFFARLLND